MNNMMIWGDYRSFDPGLEGPLRGHSRKTAERYFERFLKARSERLRSLNVLLKANQMVLDASDSALDALAVWLLANVEADAGCPTDVAPMWVAVIFDIGIFVGETLIYQFPNLRWELSVRSKRDLSYQSPVVAGFRKAVDGYVIQPERPILALAHRGIANLPVDLRTISTMVKRARAVA